MYIFKILRDINNNTMELSFFFVSAARRHVRVLGFQLLISTIIDKMSSNGMSLLAANSSPRSSLIASLFIVVSVIRRKAHVPGHLIVTYEARTPSSIVIYYSQRYSSSFILNYSIRA